MNLKTNLADKSNYGSYRSVDKIKYIVIHYTANDGDTDESNAKFFKTKGRGASAHYFVDDDSVTLSVPDTYVAWSVGGKRYSNYKSTGGAKYYGYCTNNNSLNVELCDTVRDGKLKASEKTLANAAELVRSLMAKYHIPLANVIRHFDVTGKACPAYWASNSNAGWASFCARLTTDSFVFNGVDYAPVFNASFYAQQNPDVAKAFNNNKNKLFEHFCLYGMKEGRRASKDFDVAMYKARYADLANVFKNDLPKYYWHYCTMGRSEGRKAV